MTSGLEGLLEQGLIAEDWAEALAPVDEQIKALGEFLRAEKAAGQIYLPEASRIFRAFERPMAEVRVLIMGQDPYPTEGHPVGLSFSVAPETTPIPKSLISIFRELHDDLPDVQPDPPLNGDLTPWADQGVMLLNRVLTVRKGVPGSHRGRGWEGVTERAITALAARGGPCAAILWGRDAQSIKPLLGPVPWVESVHPSPLSAPRGFFGSKPFSRVNDKLVQLGGKPVDWHLPSATRESRATARTTRR